MALATVSLNLYFRTLLIIETLIETLQYVIFPKGVLIAQQAYIEK